jgi:hypothetical protein
MTNQQRTEGNQQLQHVIEKQVKYSSLLFSKGVLKSPGLQHSDAKFPYKEAWDENYLHMHCSKELHYFILRHSGPSYGQE